MKKLPIGIQSFEKLINGEYLYVDKTEHIYQLITSGEYYFLSRPRRFGKSLLCSTLKALFEGKRELFKDLWIASSDYAWAKHPIVLLDFANIRHETPQEFKKQLLNRVTEIAQDYNIPYKSDMISEEIFNKIVKSLARKNKVVLLIDEYDKPILDHLHAPEIAQQMREILRSFYSTIKSLDEYLRFVLLTGVSKFSKTSVFSGINNLEDITLTEGAATLLGYTQAELVSYFADRIDVFANKQNKGKKEVLERLRAWYNGYRFSKRPQAVYNPFSILLAFKQFDFDNYWFKTGTPTFLINLLKQIPGRIEDLDGIRVQADDIEAFEIENISLVTLLFQTGYLTIKGYDPTTRYYRLGYPNEEVKLSFFNRLLSSFTSLEQSFVKGYLLKLIEAVGNNDIDRFLRELQSLFAQIPYTINVNQEKYYQTIFYLIGTLLGFQIDTEVVTNMGRIDLIITTLSHIYLFEFKMDLPAQRGLDQVEKKKYYEKYQLAGKNLVLIGVSFNSEKRNICSDWKIKEI